MKKRVMKGGEYSAPSKVVTFIRRMPRIAGAKDLYKLTSTLNDDDSITHELDFSFYKGGYLTNKFITPDRYKEILKKDLIVNDIPQQKDIDDLIDQLFEGGIPGIMQRKLVIKENTQTKVGTTIHILENNDQKGNEIIINTGKSFVDYLRTKGNEIENRSE